MMLSLIEHPVIAYIALGSNLDNPMQQILTALGEIDQLQHTKVRQHSRLYRTTPVGGPVGQAHFINAVAQIQTRLTPHALLRALQYLEQQHHRKRKQKWGPRTLDLDILLYSEEQVNSPELIIPHPEMHQRDFVLIPLADITPQQVAN